VAAALVFLGLIVGLAPLVAAVPLWAASGMLAATALLAFDRETPAKLRAMLVGAVPYPRVVAGDVLITLTVMVTALAVDLIAAVGAGMALAALLFVLGMGRDPVRRVYSGVWVRSKVQRPQPHLDILQREGGRIVVMELQGALFFGACAAFARQIDAVLGNSVQHLILDCRHLSALDSTGASRLAELAERMRAGNGQLILSHVVPERRRPENRRLRAKRDAGPQAAQAAVGAARPEREWTPRWIWLRLQATGALARLGPDGLADDTDAALARCEEAVLRRFTPSVSGLSAILADSPVLSGLGPEPLGVLASLALRRRYRAGAIVFREGDKGDAAFFLARGRMDVLIDIPGSARRKRVSVLAAGSLFGELGLIDGRPRSATVRASEPSVCLVLPRSAVEYLERNRPDIILQLMRNVSVELAGRLRGANAMISELDARKNLSDFARI
jgi:SulP family sulfate permease